MVEEVEKTCSINEKRVDSLAERTCRFTLAARSPDVCVFFFLFGCFVCVCVLDDAIAVGVGLVILSWV